MSTTTPQGPPRTPPAPVLLGSQLLFNIGFFAVIPFLTVTLRDDLHLSSAAVGLVLGARTFSQQGLFLVGGALADRFGPRRLILVGCAVRVGGYLVLGLAGGFPLILLGAVLTGMGGALFSPALELLVARADARARPGRPAGRPSLFAALAMVGEVGAAVGPLVGAALLGLGFTPTVLISAALFAVVAVVLSVLLPPDQPTHTPAAQGRSTDVGEGPAPVRPRRLALPASVTDRRFLAFAAAYSMTLLAYNQMYLGLPYEVERTGGDAGTLAALFLTLSVMTVALQWPVALVARRIGARRALPLGFLVMAAGFAVVAWQLGVTTGPAAAIGAPVLVVCLAVGHMLVSPVALELVPDFAGERPWGSYYGLLATAGGTAVLIGNTALGGLFGHAEASGQLPTLPWVVLTVLAVIAAATISRYLPTPAAPRLQAAATHDRSTT